MRKILFFALCSLLFALNGAYGYTSADCTNVQQLSAQGVVSYRASCAEYNLDRTITRQEVAAVALKVGEVCGSIANIPPSGGYRCDNMFSDVSASYPNDWVCRTAETLARDGVVSQNDQNQYGDTFFRPLKNVTRAEALAMVLNAGNLEFQGVTYDDWRFTGTGAVSWQKPLMQYAYDRDIISSITAFGPNTNAYRRDVFHYAADAINLCRGNGGSNNNYNNNNTYNTQCGLGQYRSGNTCYSCNALPTNAYFPTINSCVWTCNSGYYKSGNSCVSNYNNNNNYYGNNAQCSTTVANSCISGYASHLSIVGNYSYWSCNGTNGTTASCSMYGNNNYYSTTGQCGSSINSCISGSFYDTTDYGNYAYWNCTGSNGSAVSCSAYNNYNNNCSVGQYFAGNMCLSCTTKPSYAVYTTTNSCDWNCNSGYYKSGNSCVLNYGTTGQCGSAVNSCTTGYV
jgi:S-layer homology domain